MNLHLRILDFALAGLLRRRTKTLVVVTVYSLLVALLSSLLLFTRALRQEAHLLLATAPDLVVQRLSGGRHEPIAVERAARIREIRGVAAVTPRVWGYSYDPPTEATLTFWGAESVPRAALDFSDGTALGAEPRSCVVGQGVADLRFLGVGDRLPIRGSDGELYAPKVVGIFSATSAILTYDLVVLPTAELRRIFALAPDMATDLAVSVRNPREVSTVAKKVREAWPDVRTVSREQILQTYDAVLDYRAGIWAALLLCTVAAFAVLVLDQATGLSAEEHRTLGILKAVGWTPRNVLELKLWEGTIVSAAAFLTGVLAAEVHLLFFDGALFAAVLKGWSVLFPSFRVRPDFDAFTLLPCLMLLLLPYVAASLVPSWRASVTDPDSVLRASG